MAASGEPGSESLSALLASVPDSPIEGAASGVSTRSSGRPRARSRGAAAAEEDEDGSGGGRRGARRGHAPRLRTADARALASAAAVAITPADRSCDLTQLHALIDGLASRWLGTAELYRFLHSFRRFGIPVLDAALQRPASGTWALYAPGVKVRGDGYEYAKRQDANNYTIVKEGHVTLHMNGIPTMACYYATREDRPSFSRRIYWLVDREFAAAPGMPPHVTDASIARPSQPVSLDRYLPSVVPLPPPDGTAIDPAVRGVILAHYIDSEDTVTPHAVALNASVWANAMRASSDASARHSASLSAGGLGEAAEEDAAVPVSSSTSGSGRPQRARRGLLRPGAPTSIVTDTGPPRVATGMTPSPATDAKAHVLSVVAAVGVGLGSPGIIPALEGEDEPGATAALASVSVRGSMERTSLDVAAAWRTQEGHLSASLAHLRPMSAMSMASHGGGEAILPRRTPRPLSVLSSLSDTPVAGGEAAGDGPVSARIVLVNPPTLSMRRVDAAMVCYDSHIPASPAGPAPDAVTNLKAMATVVVCANLSPLFPASFASLTTAAVQAPVTHIAHNVVLIPAMPVLRDFAGALAADPRLASLGMTTDAVMRAAAQLPTGYTLHATLTLFHSDASRATAPFVCAYVLDGEEPGAEVAGGVELPRQSPVLHPAVSSGDMGLNDRPLSMTSMSMHMDADPPPPQHVLSPTVPAIPVALTHTAAAAVPHVDAGYAHTGKRSRDDAGAVEIAPRAVMDEDGDESAVEGGDRDDDVDLSDGYSDAAGAASPEMSGHDTDVVRLEVETERLLVRVTEQLAQLEAYADDRTSVISDAATSVRARGRPTGRGTARRRSVTSEHSGRSPRVPRPAAAAAAPSNAAACAVLPLLRDAVNGRTLLHMAVTSGAVDIAVALIAAGADVRAADAFGITPLAIAHSTGNVAMLQALEKAWVELEPEVDDGMSVTGQRKRAAIAVNADSDVRVPGLPTATGGRSIARRRTIASSVGSADESSHAEAGHGGDDLAASTLSMGPVEQPVGTGAMSMVDRRVLLDAFDSLSLREKLAVARALQLPVQADGGQLQQTLNATLASMDAATGGGSVAALRDMFTQETLALAGERTRSVAHAMSLMSTDELADTEAEAMRIQSNVRAWLARRNYQHVRHATRTLQRAIRNMLARRRQRGGEAGQAPDAHSGVAVAASSSDLPTIQEMHELPDALDMLRSDSVSTLAPQALVASATVSSGISSTMSGGGSAMGAGGGPQPGAGAAQPPGAGLDLDVQRSKTRAHAAGVLQRSLRRWYGHAAAHDG